MYLNLWWSGLWITSSKKVEKSTQTTIIIMIITLYTINDLIIIIITISNLPQFFRETLLYVSFFSGRSKTQISHNFLLQVQPPPAFEACHHCDETRQAGASQQNVPGLGLWDSGVFTHHLGMVYMIYIWFIYIYMVYIWCIYMVYIWFIWFIHGLYMVYTWFIYGLYMFIPPIKMVILEIVLS